MTSDIAKLLNDDLRNLRNDALEMGLGVLGDLVEAGQFINNAPAHIAPNWVQLTPAQAAVQKLPVITLYYLPIS